MFLKCGIFCIPPVLSWDSWMYPCQRTPMGNPYIILLGIYGLLSPRIRREHYKYHGHTVRGTPNGPLILCNNRTCFHKRSTWKVDCWTSDPEWMQSLRTFSQEGSEGTFCIFIPISGRFPILTSVFQMGWFNHLQLDLCAMFESLHFILPIRTHVESKFYLVLVKTCFYAITLSSSCSKLERNLT